MEIGAFTNMIIGLPSDNAESLEDTIRVAEEIFSTGAEIAFTVCTPFPGSSIWISPEEFGMEIVDFDLDHYDTFTPVFNTKSFNTGEIRNLFYKAVKTIGKMRMTRIPLAKGADSDKT